jgi:phospholipid/cholesterol/gamma-HCH transport system substrate-binding protein
MKTRTNDAIVGLTVLGVIGALFLGIAWLKQANIGPRQPEVVARSRDVGNVRVGNAVVIRGVVSGRLQAIELAPDGWVDVKMKIDRGVELPADPAVLFNESSLFGEWQATIVERAALPPDDEVRGEIAAASGVPGVLPGTKLPDIGKLTSVAGTISGDVANIARRVNTAFDDQAARELRASIKNVADVSKVLAGTVRARSLDLDTISLQLRRAVAALDRTAGTVQRAAERVDSSTSSGDVKHIVDNLAVASGDLRRTAADVRDMAARLGKSLDRADTFLANSDSVMAKINGRRGTLGLLVNDPSLYRQSDSMMVQLRSLVTDIKANPGRYFKVRIF